VAQQLERDSPLLTIAVEGGGVLIDAHDQAWQVGQRSSVYGELGKLWDQSGDARISSGINANIGVKVLW
jgi:hypothetical protein